MPARCMRREDQIRIHHLTEAARKAVPTARASSGPIWTTTNCSGSP
jgi:hypothetical protein